MKGSFLPLLFRMKYINRWGLMYNTQTENLSQHTVECALLAHFLANIGNVFFGKSYDAERLVTHTLYHDISEILTGDLPTPIKYYNKEIKDSYKAIEKHAAQKLLEQLPERLRPAYREYLAGELGDGERKLLKIADKLCAYIKCILELDAGNKEFSAARWAIHQELEAMDSEELAYFLERCLPYFSMPLDELGGVL